MKKRICSKGKKKGNNEKQQEKRSKYHDLCKQTIFPRKSLSKVVKFSEAWVKPRVGLVNSLEF